jgi:tetratricopeptide (TPR) repeat protein
VVKVILDAMLWNHYILHRVTGIISTLECSGVLLGMKPIGTITKYYPFLDEATRKTLDSLMMEASDFNDFLIRLGNYACSREVPLPLAYMAAVWAWHGEAQDIQERIAERYGHHLVIAPWTFSSLHPTEGRDHQARMSEALDKAIVSEPEEWILFLLLLRKNAMFGATPEGIWAFDAARNLLNNNPELECFRPEILHGEARIMDLEGDKLGAIETSLEVLEMAREEDNPYLAASLLLDLGSKVSQSDFHRAMKFVDEAYSIAETLGLPRLVRSTLLRMSHISHKLGEYDLALKCLFDSTSIETSPRLSGYHTPIDVSDIYADLGDGEEALNWILAYEEAEGTGPAGLSGHGCPEFAMARALLLLGRTDEALTHIDRLKEIAIKSGWEPWLAGHYYIAGLYEIATGEISNGMHMIESALEISRRRDMQAYVNMCLLALVEAEIMAYEADDIDMDPMDSGPWMKMLEEEASDKRLTGILMQHALLKAEFRLKLDQTKAAREILEEALDISDLSSVKTLRGRILNQLDNLERLATS